MNERITEDIVRDHFKADPLFSQALFEEQKSKNPRIDKLLAAASKSKKGKGPGRPEFIISFPNLADFVIVMECKADVSRHESPGRDRYDEFAVDGVLLYASHLAKQFDVLAIGVSGATGATLKISHFSWRAGATHPDERPEDTKLLSFQSYISAYKGVLALSHIEGLKVTEKAVEYNEFLNDYSIPETERATFISAILVALQDEAFRRAYKLLRKPADLAADIITAAERVLSEHKVDQERKSVVLSVYRTIQNQDIAKSETISKAGLAGPAPNTILRDITSDIETNVFPLIAGGRSGLDVLGRFYTEFIRYSGSDARTGLVLTPQHITQLFCEIANLTTTDVVLDPCCGTGGFLTAAMQYMWEKVGSDYEARERIKNVQLVGIERRTDMFTHAISNMMMRGDGKSHIFRGDCFNEADREKVQALRPTVGMLNPPYDVGAAGQLQFVENALKIIGRGRCIAICQMSAAIQQTGDIIAARERLLQAHTLEAAMSMPHDLFHPVGAVTCLLVLRAGEPHPTGFRTYFGYWRDDGFVKRKHKGRVSDGSWPEKKAKMVRSFINRESQPGFSVVREVTAKDEWCAEAYMKSDISGLSGGEFVSSIKNYIAFRLIETPLPIPVSATKVSNASVSLWARPWAEFSFKHLFDVRKGKRLTKADMEPGNTPFVGAVEVNNGLTYRIDADPRHPANTITVVYNGNGVAQAYYQPEPFWCTDDVNVLYPRFDMSPKVALFLATVIRREKYRFNYGRKWGKERMQDSILNLPAGPDGEPDWAFMREYMDSLPFSADL